MEIPGSVLVKIGNNAGQLWVDIEVYEKIDGEVIKKLTKDEFKEFGKLLSDLYLKRYEFRPDIFDKGYKLSSLDMNELCRRKGFKGAFLCFREGKIVGFIVYEFSDDKESRAYRSKSNLVVKDIYVIQEYRRLGIASRLFNEVKKIASRFKCENVIFKVWNFDEAMNKFILSLHYKLLYSLYEVEV